MLSELVRRGYRARDALDQLLVLQGARVLDF